MGLFEGWSEEHGVSFERIVCLHPLKINMELKNGGLEDDFPILLGHYEVP